MNNGEFSWGWEWRRSRGWKRDDEWISSWNLLAQFQWAFFDYFHSFFNCAQHPTCVEINARAILSRLCWNVLVNYRCWLLRCQCVRENVNCGEKWSKMLIDMIKFELSPFWRGKLVKSTNISENNFPNDFYSIFMQF